MASIIDILSGELREFLIVGKRPHIPEAGALIWQLYCEISRSRTYHATGPNPLQWTEIEAWARLNRWPLQPHHVTAIMDLDATWRECVMMDKSEQPSGPLSAEAFDAAMGF